MQIPKLDLISPGFRITLFQIIAATNSATTIFKFLVPGDVVQSTRNYRL